MSLTHMATRSIPRPDSFHGPRQFKLGADTVRGRDKDRVRKAGGLDIEQATESAERAVGTGPPCPFASGAMSLTSASPASISTPASR